MFLIFFPKNMVAQKIRNSRFSSLLLHFLSIQTSKNIYKTMIKLRYSNKSQNMVRTKTKYQNSKPILINKIHQNTIMS